MSWPISVSARTFARAVQSPVGRKFAQRLGSALPLAGFFALPGQLPRLGGDEILPLEPARVTSRVVQRSPAIYYQPPRLSTAPGWTLQQSGPAAFPNSPLAVRIGNSSGFPSGYFDQVMSSFLYSYCLVPGNQTIANQGSGPGVDNYMFYLGPWGGGSNTQSYQTYFRPSGAGADTPPVALPAVYFTLNDVHTRRTARAIAASSAALSEGGYDRRPRYVPQTYVPPYAIPAHVTSYSSSGTNVNAHAKHLKLPPPRQVKEKKAKASAAFVKYNAEIMSVYGQFTEFRDAVKAVYSVMPRDVKLRFGSITPKAQRQLLNNYDDYGMTKWNYQPRPGLISYPRTSEMLEVIYANAHRIPVAKAVDAVAKQHFSDTLAALKSKSLTALTNPFAKAMSLPVGFQWKGGPLIAAKSLRREMGF